MNFFRNFKALSSLRYSNAFVKVATNSIPCVQMTYEEDFQLMNQIEERIHKIVQKNVEIQIKKIDRERDFKQLGLDSLYIVDIIVEMEQSIGIDISNEEAENIRSIHTAIATFSKHLHSRIKTEQIN